MKTTNKTRGRHVMPASKRKYDYNDEHAAKIHCLKDMFAAPRPNKKRKTNADSDSSSSDDIYQSKQATKDGTSQLHILRAVDSQLLNAGTGGVATWREKMHPAGC